MSSARAGNALLSVPVVSAGVVLDISPALQQTKRRCRGNPGLGVDQTKL